MSDSHDETPEPKGCEESIRQGEVAFSTFVLSLGTSVLVHLGAGDPEDSEASEVNLPMARHVIDILAMLKEKTVGNLKDDEQKLIDNLLFDLRLKFVETCKNQGETPSETQE